MRWLCAAGVSLLLAACATTQGRHVPLGPILAARAPDAPVGVFKDAVPERPFERIARLDAHLEKAGFRKSSFEDALPELQRQARLAGADAIVEPHEQHSQVGETMIYHVTAVGIRYIGAPAATNE
jgi:hypothetical protein